MGLLRPNSPHLPFGVAPLVRVVGEPPNPVKVGDNCPEGSIDRSPIGLEVALIDHGWEDYFPRLPIEGVVFWFLKPVVGRHGEEELR